MQYFLNPENQEVFAYDPDTQQALIGQAIEAGWTNVTGSWPPGPTKDETIANINSAIQLALDNGARAWGYTDLVTAASYATATNAQFAADAAALIGWRDAVWEWALPRYDSVTPGETPAQFMATMPAQPPQPNV